MEKKLKLLICLKDLEQRLIEAADKMERAMGKDCPHIHELYGASKMVKSWRENMLTELGK